MTEEKKPKLDLSAPTVLAGAGATITMSVLGSFLGPQGTIIGGAMTSVASTIITAVYKHTLTVSQYRAKSAALQLAAKRKLGESSESQANRILNDPEFKEMRKEVNDLADRSHNPWRPRVLMTGAALAAGLFGGVLALETGAEAVAGKPVSAIVQGKPGSGTTLGNPKVYRGGPVPVHSHAPTPTPEPSDPNSPGISVPASSQSLVPAPSTTAPLPSNPVVPVPPAPSVGPTG